MITAEIKSQPVYNKKAKVVSSTIKVQSNLMEPNVVYIVQIIKKLL